MFALFFVFSEISKKYIYIYKPDICEIGFGRVATRLELELRLDVDPKT